MTSNREDAIRKVQGLMRLAADEGATPGERSAATEKVNEMRLKHGIGDADLAAADEDDEFVFMGHRMFYFNRHIQPHLDRIKEEIDRALTKADSLDAQNRAETYSRLYKELREMVEGSAYRRQLKQRRDAQIKALYHEIAAEYAESHRGHVNDGMQHAWARDRVASICDIRKDTVERIVGLTERAIWEREMRAIVCSICGLDGREKRQMCELYEIDGERVWQHPACHDAAEPATSQI